MSNKDNFKSWLNSNTTKAQTPAVPNTLYKTAYSKNITTEEWNALLSYLNKAIAKTNSWLTGFQESYDSIPDLSVLYDLKDNTVPLWDTSKQAFINSTISVFDGLLKITNSLDKDCMDIDKNSFTVYTEDNNTGIKFKLPKLRSSVAEVSLLTDALPIREGSGANAIVVNDISGETTNVACSENASAFGTGNTVGLKGYYWSSISFTDKTITLSTAHNNGITLTSCDYAVGDILSIVNDIKYDCCCTVTAVNGGIITVDSLPFTEIIDGDSTWDAYTVFCVNKPQIGLVDIGIAAFATGENCKATNSHSFAAGRNNQVIGEYGVSVGRDNVSGYASFTAGRNNKYYGQAGAMLGQDNSGTGNKQFSLGFKNQHGNYDRTYSIGNYNTLNATGDIAIGNTNELNVGEALSVGENVAIGAQNKLYQQHTIALGYSNNVSTGQVEPSTYDFAAAFGSNNTVANNYSGAIGRSNTVRNFGTWAMGISLTSTRSIQTLLGGYNATSGLYEDTASVIVGGGASGALKTLATLSNTGVLHLAGDQLSLRHSDGKDVSVTSADIKAIDQLLANIDSSANSTTVKTPTMFTQNVTLSKNLTVAGDFKVTGTTTVQDVKNLAVEDLTITLGKNLQGLGSSLAGLVVPDYNGMQQPGGLVFDDTGTAYVGDVDRTSDGTVSIGNAKPIAVRSTASEWSDNNIPRWNTAFEGFEPSGFTTDSFVQKNTETHGYYLYARMRGTEGVISYSNVATANCIPYYGAGGVLRAGTAVGDNDAVNLKQLTDGWVKKHVHAPDEYDLLYGQNRAGDIMFSVATRAKAYAIPSYGERKTLQTSTASLDAECVNLKQMKEYAVPIKTAADTPNLYNVTGTPFVYGHINSAGTETETTIGLAYDDSSIAALEGSFKIPVMDQDGMLRSAGVVGTFPEAGGTVLPNCDDVNSIVSSAQEKLVLTYLNLPSNKTGTNGQILVASGYEDYYDYTTGETTQYSVLNWADPPKPVRHWLATLVKASDPDVNGGQIEFWSTGTPNSETNPTNFSDLFAKRIGRALIRNLNGSNAEYFVYMLGVGGLTGVQYYTAYPFTEMNTTGVTYDSVTLAEIT